MSGPANLVLLTEVPTEADAILLREALAEHGVRAVYNGAAIAGFRAEAPAMVRVLVAADDLVRAEELLAEDGLERGEQVDWSRVDVGEAELPETSEPIQPLNEGTWVGRYVAFEVLTIAVIALVLLIM